MIYTFADVDDACSPGALFRIGVAGGADGEGAVYELSPPPSPGGSWTESVVYSLPGSVSGLVIYHPEILAIAMFIVSWLVHFLRYFSRNKLSSWLGPPQP